MNIKWIDVTKQLPKNNPDCVCSRIMVLILMQTERGLEIGKGFYAHKHQIIDGGEVGCSKSDYCEKRNVFYAPEGWYVAGANEDSWVFRRDNVVAWMDPKQLINLWEFIQHLDKISSVDLSDGSEEMGVDITETLDEEFRELL